MRKIQKIMLAVICAGFFIGGLGVGIAFLEFSSLSYAGEKEIPYVKMITENIDYAFEPSDDLLHIQKRYQFENEIFVSNEVPENTVRFQVTYNSENTSLYLDNFADNWVGLSYYYISDIGDELRSLMYCKDEVLQGLKNREIISFKFIQIDKVKIIVNPASRDLVKIS